MSTNARTSAALEARLRKAAHRAVDNPITLRRATLIVRAALDHHKLTLADLTPLPADGGQ